MHEEARETPWMRTERLLGADALERLAGARVAVFGLGGVGGMLAEALCRSGVGKFMLVDRDVVSVSNLNRQIVATRYTVGRNKTEVMRERILAVNPAADVEIRSEFFLPETADRFDFSAFDYVADAVDTVTAKLELVMRARAAGVPVLSCMGTGNKLDAGALRIADISETSVCPLARVMRRELRKRGIDRLKVLYSTEAPRTDGDRTPGSVSWVPPAAGLLMAGEIVRDLIRGS